MDSAASLKPKVTVKLNHDKPNGTTPLRAYGIAVHSRPPSPVKSYVSSSPQILKNIEHGMQANNEGAAVFRPKAKVNSSATARRPGTAAGSNVGSIRPSSPTKLPAPRLRATISSSNAPTSTSSSRPASSVTVSGTRTPRAPPTSSAPVTPQVRTRGLQVPSSNDDPSPTRPNPPAGLHHATSMLSFSTVRAGSVVGESSTVSSSPAPHRLLGSRSVAGLTERERTLTSSPTLKIRSKVTAMSKANTEPGNATAGSSSSPTSPVHASVRSSTPNPTVNPRARAPSTVSLNPRSPPPHATSTASAESTSIPNAILRARAPSTVSSAPTSPPPQFYPITTAVSAANPHRFASARPPASSPPHSPPAASNATTASRASPTLGVQPTYQSFSSMPSNRANINRTPNVKNLAARVDPATIPLPPHSPPASSVSFSSRSSMSHLEPPSRGGHSRTGSASTSGGSRNSQGPHIGGNELRETLDNLMMYTSETTSEDEGSGPEEGRGAEVGEEYKVKAAAKSDRKMADLEITNRSLLAINASLEATKHRQAKEIHELRRRLREARLILPPRAFRASKDSTLSTYTDADLGLDAASSSSDDEEHEDNNENDESKEKSEGDAAYRRVKLLLDALLKQGTAALEHDKDAVGTRGGVAKVLSPEEVRDYHAGGEGEDGEGDHEDGTPEDGSVDASNDYDHEFDEDAGDDTREDVSEEYIPLDGETSFDSIDSSDAGNTTLTSEDEVEAMTIIGSPPILITKPS